MIIQKGIYHYSIQTLQKNNHCTALQRGPKLQHPCYRKLFRARGNETWSVAHEHTGEDRSRSEAIALETSMLCFQVQLPCNSLAHVVSVSKGGGGFRMWSGNMVNIFTLPSAVPFACLTFQRLTLSSAGSCVRT